MIAEQLAGADVLLLSRRTYDGWAETWPQETGEAADKYNAIFVASNTLEAPAWAGTQVIHDDLVGAVQGRKQKAGGDVMTFGSAPSSRNSSAAGLVDELVTAVRPTLAGVGSSDELLF